MWSMPSHWTYQCVIIVWTITISIHLGKLFLDCKCTTVSGIRLKWEMPYLPGINKHYRSISFYHLTTFWHAQAWKTFVLIYCFRILAAADGRDCVSQLLWTQDGNWQGVLIMFNRASRFVDPHVVLFDYTSKQQILLYQSSSDSISFLPRKVYGLQSQSEYARRWYHLAC
jgi:hypothetical protein